MDPTIERERERDSFFNFFFFFKQQEACFSLTVRTRNVSHETVKLSDETSVRYISLSGERATNKNEGNGGVYSNNIATIYILLTIILHDKLYYVHRDSR